MIDKDRLLKFLTTYLEKSTVIWEGEFIIPDIYSKLKDIGVSANKESILLEYLNDWYTDRKDTSWYDSDKGSNETYVGYWSFECAAIAKAMKIDDDRLKENVYYPKF